MGTRAVSCMQGLCLLRAAFCLGVHPISPQSWSGLGTAKHCDASVETERTRSKAAKKIAGKHTISGDYGSRIINGLAELTSPMAQHAIQWKRSHTLESGNNYTRVRGPHEVAALLRKATRCKIAMHYVWNLVSRPAICVMSLRPPLPWDESARLKENRRPETPTPSWCYQPSPAADCQIPSRQVNHCWG